MNIKICFVLLLSTVFLISCQSTSEHQALTTFDRSSLYSDHLYQKPSNLIIESEQEIFKLDNDMQQLVRDHLRNGHTIPEKVKTLIEQIFAEENIALSYESNANLTAQQAFHSKKANCMSLTIMAYSLATQAGLDLDFQQVDIPEYWVRNGEYNMLTGHVNLLVNTQGHNSKKVVWGSDDIQIDFDPYVIKQSFPKRKITKNTVVAMFYNNKGAEALVKENYNVAYYYFKAATLQDKNFSSAWGNLGILYRLSNQLDLAERTYDFTVLLDEKNFTAMTNLAVLYRMKNKISAAELIENKLHYMRIDNPFYHALLADEAFYDQDYNQAILHYKDAIKLESGIHEFYYGLAQVYYQLDKLVLAKKSMDKAIKLNRLPAIESQYIAKLNFLNQSGHHN